MEVGVMPKEVIRTPNPTPFSVELKWNREQYVQIATVNTGEPQLAEVRGWFADLDRAGINQLIRALRKARDQAFGSDA